MASVHEAEVEAVVEGYFEAINNHDTDAALAYLAPNFTLTFTGADMTLDKEGFRVSLGWDAASEGVITHTFIGIDGTVATLRAVEQNAFLQLLGLGPLHSRLTLEVGSDGLIRHMTHQAIPMPDIDGLELLEERLAPAVDWIKRNHPEALEEIYPEGRIRFTRESGKRWVELLRGWRKADGAP